MIGKGQKRFKSLQGRGPATKSFICLSDAKEWRVGAMNTTWTKQDLLDQFGRVATILHHGLAFIGLTAVGLILARGKALFFDEHATRPAPVGSTRSRGG